MNSTYPTLSWRFSCPTFSFSHTAWALSARNSNCSCVLVLLWTFQWSWLSCASTTTKTCMWLFPSIMWKWTDRESPWYRPCSLSNSSNLPPFPSTYRGSDTETSLDCSTSSSFYQSTPQASTHVAGTDWWKSWFSPWISCYYLHTIISAPSRPRINYWFCHAVGSWSCWRFLQVIHDLEPRWFY